MSSTRITTKSIMQGYNRNLNLSLHRWNTAQNKVLTQRNFSTIAEDPAGANRAFQLRRQFRNNAAQAEMTEQTQALIDQATSIAMQISDIITNNVSPDIVKASSDTYGLDERKTFAETLRGHQQSILLAANSQITGRYIFGGESTKEIPFTMENGTLYYRGQEVDTLPADTPLATEALYVDLGFGLEEDANGVVSTSAFNTSTPGINMLGYGTDDNGLPNNVLSLLGVMADALEQPNFDHSHFTELMDKFQESCVNHITNYEAELGTKQNFLDGTLVRLQQYNDTINKRLTSIEMVDMPEAISTYTWMGYAYNAALKVGTDIVSNSLFDFMR